MTFSARMPFWLALGAACFFAVGACFDLSKSDWASWVQAVGSIFAIAATAWAVNRSHSLSAEKAANDGKADEIRRLSAIASSIFQCRAEAESLRRYAAYLEFIDRETHRLERHVNMLQSIALLDIPDWRAAVAVTQAIAMFSHLEGKLRERIPLQQFTSHLIDARVGHCKHAIEKFEECERILQTTLKDRGADVPQQQVAFADGVIASVSVITGEKQSIGQAEAQGSPA